MVPIRSLVIQTGLEMGTAKDNYDLPCMLSGACAEVRRDLRTLRKAGIARRGWLRGGWGGQRGGLLLGATTSGLSIPRALDAYL